MRRFSLVRTHSSARTYLMGFASRFPAIFHTGTPRTDATRYRCKCGLGGCQGRLWRRTHRLKLCTEILAGIRTGTME